MYESPEPLHSPLSSLIFIPLDKKSKSFAPVPASSSSLVFGNKTLIASLYGSLLLSNMIQLFDVLVRFKITNAGLNPV